MAGPAAVPILLGLAAVATVHAVFRALAWRKYAGHGRGTPGYARARDGRRYAAWSLLVALVLVALAGLAAARAAPLF